MDFGVKDCDIFSGSKSENTGAYTRQMALINWAGEPLFHLLMAAFGTMLTVLLLPGHRDRERCDDKGGGLC